MLLAVLFPASACLAFIGLCALALHDVPRFLGTVAFALTLAALGVAVLR